LVDLHFSLGSAAVCLDLINFSTGNIVSVAGSTPEPPKWGFRE
jgi:hypothetical protein